MTVKELAELLTALAEQDKRIADGDIKGENGTMTRWLYVYGLLWPAHLFALILGALLCIPGLMLVELSEKFKEWITEEDIHNLASNAKLLPTTDGNNNEKT